MKIAIVAVTVILIVALLKRYWGGKCVECRSIFNFVHRESINRPNRMETIKFIRCQKCGCEQLLESGNFEY